MSHENHPSAPRFSIASFRSPPEGGVRTILLFTMSIAGASAGGNQKTEVSAKSLSAASEFWLLISKFWFSRQAGRACQACWLTRPEGSPGAAFTSLRERRPGGARRDRTDDLLLAKQALSQLSYGPWPARRSSGKRPRLRRAVPRGRLVGLDRVERSTSPLSGVRSNQLSYRPMAPMGRKAQAPPARPSVGRTRLSKKERRRRRDLACS